MLNIVLFEPEIPPNTGNIIRLCANTGSQLHLIEPLGFKMDDKALRRAGLDYHEYANIQTYVDWQDFSSRREPLPLYFLTTKAEKHFGEVKIPADAYFVFGPESRGLPDYIRQDPSGVGLRLPMMPNSRSMNLSNAVSVVVYDAWRQQGFAGGV